MLTRFLTILALCVTATLPALADEASLKQALEAKFPGIPVQSITMTPYNGLYEVMMQGEVFYMDDAAQFFFQGNIIELKTDRNVTLERTRDLLRVTFDELPLDSAIKIVKGNGERQVAVFSDPDCPFCKELETQLKLVDNVTVYTFLYPIEDLHAGATAKAAGIWCAADPVKTWHDWMLNGVTPPKASDDCKTPVAELARLALNIRVGATPTLIFSNGERHEGSLAAADLENALESIKAMPDGPEAAGLSSPE